ncbi:MAG: hypothetical protein AMS24_04210 [Chlamydiae bacterium SM23_39]|nr:MAG: hypothetical protein AMS24_04210 [Chlamydiae bacterium SM23_39]
MKYIFIFLIKIYQIAISPFIGKHCRFTPSCSEYSILALKKYSFFKAIFLIFKRILKCNPFNKGGNDPLI